MKLGKFAQWFHRKRLNAQVKTFGQLEEGDFVWEVRITKNGEIVTTVYTVEGIETAYDTSFKPLTLRIGLECYYSISGYCTDIFFNNVSIANENFTFECDRRTFYFTVKKLADNFVRIKTMQRNNVADGDKIRDMEKAAENAHNFLDNELKKLKLLSIKDPREK